VAVGEKWNGAQVAPVTRSTRVSFRPLIILNLLADALLRFGLRHGGAASSGHCAALDYSVPG
jgi:hypothetical protein